MDSSGVLNPPNHNRNSLFNVMMRVVKGEVLEYSESVQLGNVVSSET